MKDLKEHHQPSYARIRDTIREQIVAGKFEVEGRLPTERELQQRFAVSRHTVRRALQDLVTEGLIQRFSGKGTYSTGLHRFHSYMRVFGDIEDIRASVENTRFHALHPLRMVYAPHVSEKLELPSSLRVGLLHGRRMREGKPLGIWSNYLPPDIVEGLEQQSVDLMEYDEAIHALIERVLGFTIGHVEQEISATNADEYTSELLQVLPGVSLLRIERTYYDITGRPIEYGVSEHAGSTQKYRIDLHRTTYSRR
jgi:DNA-binding GntR family transcriptional regulator